MNIKNLVVALVVTVAMVVCAGTVSADQLAIGGKWVDGHSFSGDYGVNNQGSQSWGFGLFYDKDYGWLKQLSKNTAIGLDPGMLAQYLRVTIQNNKERTKTERVECTRENYYDCEWDYDETPYMTKTTTEEYYTIDHANVLLLGVYPKMYLKTYKFRFFIAPIAGMELSDDEGTKPMYGGMAGIQLDITKSFGVNVTQEELWTPDRRFDITSVNAVFRF